jgi:hypothetical protein
MQCKYQIGSILLGKLALAFSSKELYLYRNTKQVDGASWVSSSVTTRKEA